MSQNNIIASEYNFQFLFIAGHLMDPWELPGTAHFCEHMLFLGTDKYPSENEYSKVCFVFQLLVFPFVILFCLSHSRVFFFKFISAHAGSTNAYTAADHTNYHFDVKPDQLEVLLWTHKPSAVLCSISFHT